MRWIVLALVLAAGCVDDDSAPATDAGPCMFLSVFGCNPCGQPTDAGTCRLGAGDATVQCYYDPHCGGWGDAG